MRSATILPAIATLGFLVGCGPTEAPVLGPPPPQVGVASAVAEDRAVSRDLTGRLEAAETVEVRPRVAGQIERVHVADGAEVAAGDPLIDLDAAPYAAAVARAEAAVARSRALRDQAALQHARSLRLAATHAVSQQALEDHAAALRAMEAEVASAEASLQGARLDLGWTRITAPIAGRIGKVLATRGNLVVGGGPMPATHLATIVAHDPIDVVFDLDESAYHAIAARLRASATGGVRVPVQVALAGEAGFAHHGAVAFVDNRVDARSGAIRLRARLDNRDRSLTSGAFARVRIEVQPARPVLLVHERAIQSQLATKYVLVVDADGVTSFRPVRLGEVVGDLRVISDGLAPGERIVASSVAKVLFPGMPVTPQAVSMRTLRPETDLPTVTASR